MILNPKPVYAVEIADHWDLAKIPEFNTLGGLVSYVVPKILLAASVIFFILVVVAGLGVITSAGGDAQAQEKAKNLFTYSILGLIIIFGAFWILQIINYITGGSFGDIL